MNWIDAGQFQLTDRNGRHYVFRRNNSGNTEINVPASVTTKAQAKRWLKNNPNKAANPTKFKPKKKPHAKGLLPWEHISPGGKKYVKIQIGGELKYRPAPPPIKKPIAAYKWAPPPPPTPPPGGWKYTGMRKQNTGRGSPGYVNFDLPCDAFKTSLTDLKAIGSGRQGKVFKAKQGGRGEFVIKIAPYDIGAKSRGEPQPFQVEFDNHKAVMDVAPGGVVAIYKTFRCQDFVPASNLNMKNVQNATKFDKSRQGIIAMEYCDGGSLASWIRSNPLSDAVFKKIIGQVLGTLAAIRQKYPHFNHNDLHLENIFESKSRGFLIGDFGWSRIKASGTNPAVNTANGTNTASFWGVGPKTDPRYDMHLFLNELRAWISRHNSAKYPKTVEFLDRVIPVGYRGETDTHVTQWRLKYADPCPGLWSLDKVLKDPYLKGGLNIANLKAAKARLRKVKTPSPKKLELIVLRPKRRVTSPMLQAAIAKLKKRGAKNLTNAELRALGAANFLKLSPKTRARAMALRAGGPANKKGKGPAPLYVNATKKTATKTEFVLPNKTKKKIPPVVLKSAKFNKLVAKIYEERGGLNGGNGFNNAWSKARTAALNQIQTRLNANKPPFSPSPPKPAKAPSPPKPKPTNNNYKLSPQSGRVLLKSNKGRWVYADGPTVSLARLKNIANRRGVSIKGLRSKANIAKKIFG